MNDVFRFRRLLIFAALLAVPSLTFGDDEAAAGEAPENDIIVSFAMFSDPLMEFPPPVTILPQKFVELWIKSLETPDAELQRQLCMAIEQVHRLQHADFSHAVEPLRALLNNSESEDRVRQAAAMALLTLGDEESAGAIMELAQSAGPSLLQAAEPVLAQWRYQPAISTWLARLNDPEVRRTDLRLAVQCLASAEESQAIPGLQSIVLDTDRASTIRLAAARSWGMIQRSGLEETARQLLADGRHSGVSERLIGASLLRHHEGTLAEEILVNLANDAEPAVAAIAWQRLLEIDSSLTLPIAGSTLASPDPRLRGFAVRAFDENPSVARLVTLSDLLSDPHIDVRNQVRRALNRHAQDPEFDLAIRQQAVRVLQSEDWRGIAQAGMLLASLDHEEIAPHLLALLEHSRSEVANMAAWGLRMLAVPETLPSMLAYAQQVNDPDIRLRGDFFYQCTHIFEAFGLMKYQPAEPLLRSFVSRAGPPPKEEYSRSAAIWSLGFLHEGQPDRALVRQLIARYQDVNSDTPESNLVRRFSLVTIGRMKADFALPVLQGNQTQQAPPASPVDYARCWAIEQITGAPVLDPLPEVYYSVNWFLVPLPE